MLTEHQDAADLAARLRAMPQETPPAGAWRRLRERAVREGLMSEAAPRPHRAASSPAWYAGVGLAASLVVALLFVGRGPGDSGDTRFEATPKPAEVATIDALMRQSQLLEQKLRMMPPTPRVRQASLASRTVAIEDRIAAIDQTLLLGSERLSRQQRVALWAERTALMNSLIALRDSGVRATSL